MTVDTMQEWSDDKITSTLLDTSDQELGRVIRDYLQDSIHNGWDGHPTTDRVAYYELFKDMIRHRAMMGGGIR